MKALGSWTSHLGGGWGGPQSPFIQPSNQMQFQGSLNGDLQGSPPSPNSILKGVGIPGPNKYPTDDSTGLCTDPCSKTFLLERGFVHFHVSWWEGMRVFPAGEPQNSWPPERGHYFENAPQCVLMFPLSEFSLPSLSQVGHLVGYYIPWEQN